MWRRWQTANDELVCPMCGPLNGKLENEPVPDHPNPLIASMGWGAAEMAEEDPERRLYPPLRQPCRCAAFLTAGG